MKKISVRFVILGLVILTGSMKSSAQDFKFHELPYAYDALTSFIDARTMEIHHGKHYKAYYTNFVKAVSDEKLEGKSLEQLFASVSKHSASVRNNGGGYYNHSLFWEVMSPNGGGEPTGALLEAINKAFGSVDNFKAAFEKAANTRFGSGWAWLLVDASKQLVVSSTPNQDNPLMDVAEQKGTPVLGLDVWEHAYYLQYQNLRGSYTANFWKVVNWEKVNELYLKAIK